MILSSLNSAIMTAGDHLRLQGVYALGRIRLPRVMCTFNNVEPYADLDITRHSEGMGPLSTLSTSKYIKNYPNLVQVDLMPVQDT